MLKSNNKTVLITMGDPAGVGPEVIALSLKYLKIPDDISISIVGNEPIWRTVCQSVDYVVSDKISFLHVEGAAALPHTLGVSTSASGAASLQYLEHAVSIIKNGNAQALVTGPVSKESIAQYIPGFKGHTTYLANAFACRQVEMMFVSDNVKLVLVTRHVSLAEVPVMVTRQKVYDVIMTSYVFIREKYGIPLPKVAVLGLNPHAGEGGHIGNEEATSILPAIEQARSNGVDISGPFPADTFFEPRNCSGYDLIVSMYHDQGLIALKALYFNQLVNLTVGLPFIRTSPVHGTAFAIAGKHKADSGSMKASIELACRL